MKVLIDLGEIPANPASSPEQPIGFSSDNVPKGALSSEKTNILSLKSKPQTSEVSPASIILGVDEVGRGCWAGPLVAGAVILGDAIAGLRDSKKLSAKQRNAVAILIHANAIATGIGWVSAKEVDSLGLTKAVGLAMQRAVDQITEPYDQLIVDGNINYFAHDPRASAVIKADDTVAEASAASIIAKVARDSYMQNISSLYPEYGFEKHVGYGTKLHMEALANHGVTDIHRLSYKPVKAAIK